MANKTQIAVNEPEELLLPIENKGLLIKALDHYSKNSMIHIDSIELQEEGNVLKVIVHPTGIRHLFNIFRLYGRMEREEEI